MNIEIANRLVNLRKQNNLSQEALAEKLGLSRQAVSKWERAEASPDIDNLIMLARLYGVSLDDLLKTEDEILLQEEADLQDNHAETIENNQENSDGEEKSSSRFHNPYEEYDKNGKDEYVHIGFDGIHVKEKEGNVVHVGWKGIHVEENKGNKSNKVHVDSQGVHVNGEDYTMNEYFSCKSKDFRKGILYSFPVDLLVIVGYIAYGVMTGIWHPSWLILFMIPLWHSLVETVIHRDLNRFAYPVLTIVAFLYIGFTRGFWHPAWVVFLTIPVYYGFINFFRAIFAGSSEKNKKEN